MRNGTGRNAAVKLIQEVKPATKKRASYLRYVYICSGETLTIREIPPGRFLLMFALGEDWDESRKLFRVDPDAFQFADSFDFHEIHQHEGVTYSTFEVTLQRVPGGTASVYGIDLDVFEASDPEEPTLRQKSL